MHVIASLLVIVAGLNGVNPIAGRRPRKSHTSVTPGEKEGVRAGRLGRGWCRKSVYSLTEIRVCIVKY